MQNTQSNTQQGPLPVVSSEDLTGKEGLLAVLGPNGIELVADIADRVPFVIDDGAAQDAKTTVIPFEPSRNIRVRAKGVGQRGDALVLADPAVAADAGKVRVLPVAAGTYHVIAIAEETFVDGQLVLTRPISREAVVVS